MTSKKKKANKPAIKAVVVDEASTINLTVHKVLKNPSNVWVNVEFRRRHYSIKPRGSLTIYSELGGQALFDYLIQTYQFLRDITPNPVHKPMKEVREARGKIV